MRKSLLIAAMAGLAFVGCTESELDQSVKSQEVIKYGPPIVSNLTKAPVAGEQVTKYSTGEKFSVYAIYHEGNYSTSAGTSVYFANVKATYNDAALVKCWDTEKSYYWPKKKNAKLTFQAYSPSETSGTIGWNVADGFTLTDFVVEDSTLNQYDLMFSKRTYDKSSNSGGTSYNDPQTAVDINFQHALSSIVFKAIKDAEYDGTIIKLKRITLLNVYSKGDYTQKLKDDASNTFVTDYPKWTGQEVEKDYVVYGHLTSSPMTVSTTAVNAIDKAVILLPQAFDHTATGKKVTVQIDYSIKTDGVGGSEIEQTNYVDLVIGNNGGYFKDGSNNIEGWEIGKKYTYNIVFSFNKIYFSPEVENWTPVDVDDNVKF